MSWEKNPCGPALNAGGGLRHPDGRPDIAAYGRIAHRERDAAVLSAVRDTVRSLRAMSLAVSRALSRPGRIRSNAPLRG